MDPVSDSPWGLYDLLLAELPTGPAAAEVLIGLTWTLCRDDDGGLGLAMSPGTPTRTLPWPGTLGGRPLCDLARWLRSWDPYEATVGMAALNALRNPDSDLAASAVPLWPTCPANLAVFEHFRSELTGQRVVVVGRYPGLDDLDLGWNLTVLERQPGDGDHPDPAAEYLLPQADWVFLTATSLVNKTFPRLAELARNAHLVLMGPTVPWVEALADWGVDYLAGVRVRNPDALRATVSEGGGTRIFETGVGYCIADLRLTPMERLRQAIAATFARREDLKRDMVAWYAGAVQGRYPGCAALTALDRDLSELDSRFKQLYDGTLGPDT